MTDHNYITSFTVPQRPAEVFVAGSASPISALVPDCECFDICSDGWGTYINGSLKALITIGKGSPNVGEPITESERVLTA